MGHFMSMRMASSPRKPIKCTDDSFYLATRGIQTNCRYVYALVENNFAFILINPRNKLNDYLHTCISLYFIKTSLHYTQDQQISVKGSIRVQYLLCIVHERIYYIIYRSGSLLFLICIYGSMWLTREGKGYLNFSLLYSLESRTLVLFLFYFS